MLVRCLALATLVAGCSSDAHFLPWSSDEEESSRWYERTESVEEGRRGVLLKLSFDSTAAAFAGTVENITESALRRVRVEVHLSDGTELGPTAPVDLDPGARAVVHLPAEGHGVQRWTAHAEVGRGEHRNGEHR